MVTYLSGERIQGSTLEGRVVRKYAIATDYSTTVSATNLASDNSDWVSSDSTNSEISSDRLNFTSDSSEDVMYYDLQNANALNGNNADDEKWVLRWTYNGTAKAHSNYFFIGLSSTTTDSGEAQDQISLFVRHPQASNAKSYGCHDIENAAPTSVAEGNLNGWDPSSGYTYYFELTRTSATAYAIRKYTDSDYDTLDQAEITGSCASTLNNLRYIKLSAHGSSDSTMSFKWDDVKFWNGVTNAATAEPADSIVNAGTDGKVAITNVPVGTRYEETDTRKIFHRAGGTNVAEWLEKGSAATHNPQRGLVGGGGPEASTVNTIDYITIASAGNASDFGDLTVARMYAGALADSTRGLWGGGGTDGSTYSNVIDYVIVATAGNATDFGDLSVARRGSAGLADTTRGCWSGGFNPAIGDDAADYANIIDYVTILTTGNASDFGDLTVGRENISSLADKTRGVWAGGHNVNDESNVMDYVTIATTGNATDFGNLLTTNNGCRGVSNNTRGCWMGHGHSVTNVIQYITIQTTGNATDFGDLTVARRSGGAMADLTRGILAGGHVSTDTMDYITIDTLGNATDFGNLTSARINLNGCAA